MMRTIFLLVASLIFSGTTTAADLKDIYLQAKEYDPTIQAAVLNHAAARERLPIAKSAFKPSINLGADASLNDVNSDLSGNFVSTRITLSVSQSLFNKTNNALIDQAEASALQADAVLRVEEQNLIIRVATAYFEVLRAQAGLAFSQAELDAIQRQRLQAEKRFDVGLVTITDVRDAQAQYDLAVAQEVAAKTALENAQETLLVLTGSNPGPLSVLSDEFALVSPDPADINIWVDRAREQNLELAISRLALQSANSVVDAQRGARYPTLDLQAIATSSTTEQTGRSDVDAGELRLEFRLPLYSGGLINAEVAQAKAEAAASEQELALQELSAVQQTRNAYRGVLSNISRAKALGQALISTEKSAEATDAGFRAGTQTSVDVLRALRDTFSAKTDFVNARYDYIINALNLKAAAGTLNEEDLFEINNLLTPQP
ncbi:MAG: TolC family outer membrane protein [Gammaproteobacteria bacterium]|nr:TolC family outer membrane protein [Gammaproteobacteria bacterium]